MRRIPALGLLILLLTGACARSTGPGVAKPTATTFVPASATLYGVVDLLTLARNGLLQDPLLARLRDKALARLGLKAGDLLRATAPAEIFSLSTDAMAIFVPGLFVEGTLRRKHRGVALLARGQDQVAARLAKGSLVGDPTAVAAALDVLHGGAPPLGKGTLRTLIEGGKAYRTVRLASSNPGQLLAMLPTAPPKTIRERIRSAAIYLTIEGTTVWARAILRGKDRSAGTDLASWAEGKRRGFRDTLSSWKENVGIFGSALEPAIAAIDAIKVAGRGEVAEVNLQTDLAPIFSSGLLSIVRMLGLLK